MVVDSIFFITYNYIMINKKTMSETKVVQMNLKEYLRSKKLSVMQFAVLTGLSLPLIYQMLRDPNHQLTRETARKIARATRTAYNDILDLVYNDL